MRLTIKVPGSCGELVQGTLNGKPFLVTCPIDVYTQAVVSLNSTACFSGCGSKAQAAVAAILDYFSVKEYPFSLSITSDLLTGKGMASSSADIAAVCFAVTASLGKTIAPETVAAIAARIEPTDGVFFDGIVQMNHITGACEQEISDIPPLQIAVFDTGGTVDTLRFHARTDLERLNRENEPLIREALALLSQADAVSVGKAASLSAIANQAILYKPQLPKILAAALELGAVGVNAAHSGTVLGLLFAPDFPSAALTKAVREMQIHFPHLVYWRTVRLVAGGYRITSE
ncbi:MAG: GHMP kinase [Selenomonadaceae bacterium]